MIGANEPPEDRSGALEVQNGALFAVMDGHGGPSCAEYCGENLLKFTGEYMSKGMSPDEVNTPSKCLLSPPSELPEMCSTHSEYFDPEHVLTIT